MESRVKDDQLAEQRPLLPASGMTKKLPPAMPSSSMMRLSGRDIDVRGR
jgi:hypothetical protein